MLGFFLLKTKDLSKFKEDMKSTKPVGHPVSTRSQENNELTYVNLILIVENCCSLKILWYFPSAKSTSNMNVLNLKLCVGRSLASFSNLESTKAQS